MLLATSTTIPNWWMDSMEYLIIIGIGVVIGICIYIACLIATDEQKRIDHEWELKESARREKESGR